VLVGLVLPSAAPHEVEHVRQGEKVPGRFGRNQMPHPSTSIHMLAGRVPGQKPKTESTPSISTKSSGFVDPVT